MSNSFGKKVKIWLIANETKQRELANMLNISDAYLSDILLGKRKGQKVRGKIMKITGIKEVSWTQRNEGFNYRSVGGVVWSNNEEDK